MQEPDRSLVHFCIDRIEIEKRAKKITFTRVGRDVE